MSKIITFNGSVLKNAVIDIETISTAGNALILSIGMVLFDHKTFVNDPSYYKDNAIGYYWDVDYVEAYKDYDFDISPETIQFWLKAGEENPGIFPGQQAPDEIMPLEEALMSMIYAGTTDIDKVPIQIESYWAHSNFDHNILKYACDQVGIDYFPYRKVRDLRTLELIAKKFGISRRDEEFQSKRLHCAMEDSLAEAAFVSAVLLKLDEVTEPPKKAGTLIKFPENTFGHLGDKV